MRTRRDTARGEGRSALRVTLSPSLFALLLLGLAAPVAAQQVAPLRFGVAWARGAPRGEFAQVARAPEGFVAWLSLPITRESPIGLRAEFSVLTVPEELVTLPVTGGGELDVTARGTVGFTGAGPRLELGSGGLALGVAVMAGYVRMITDATARVVRDELTTSSAASDSDYALAAKLSGDLHLPVYRGVRGTALALTAGADYLAAGAAAFPRRDAFRVGDTGALELERPLVRPSMLVVRAGVSVEF